MELLQNMCRICLCLDAGVNLFEEELIQPSGKLVDKFVTCTQVQVSIDDMLPKFICDVCCNRLNEAFRLRELAQDADRELKERLGIFKVDDESDWQTENSTDLLQEDDDALCKEFKSEGVEFFTLVNIKQEPPEDETYLVSERKGKQNKAKKKKENRVKKAQKNLAVSSETKKITNINESTKESNAITTTSKGSTNDSQAQNILDVCGKGKDLSDNFKAEQDDGIYNSDSSANCINSNDKTSSNKTATIKVINPLFCTFCDIVFRHTNSFRRHMRVEHHLEGFDRAKYYICDFCGNTFHDQYGLLMHQRSHTGQRPFTCNVCGQGFTQKSNMERHISAKHQKVKPYQCEICSKQFAYSSSLRDHKQQHTGQQNYQCTICDRRFGRNYSLVRHQLTHTLARPYVCKHCDRSYSQSNDLKNHVKKIHPEQPVEKLEDYCIKQTEDKFS